MNDFWYEEDFEFDGDPESGDYEGFQDLPDARDWEEDWDDEWDDWTMSWTTGWRPAISAEHLSDDMAMTMVHDPVRGLPGSNVRRLKAPWNHCNRSGRSTV
ncbi:hypothetical protein [Rhodothermus marinus]|uniref:hypothetical protein n=1 Tax=Rhodothermus marinus TaxID=29549 RepID=UPI001FB3EBCB|nr:hypothetical protein [Rhodothermus marinus]